MLQATPPEPVRPDIVITAHRPSDREAPAGLDVVVLPRARLENAPSGQLDQILKEVAGLQLFRRSDSRTGHPTSQGVTLRALGGTASSRAQLTLDGIPQADPFGGWINWPAYDPAALHDVRVTRGGGSVANGPGALAGAIELTTSVQGRLHANLEGGSRQSIEAGAGVGGALGGGSIALSTRWSSGDGFIPVTEGSRGPADRSAPYRQGNARLLWIVPVGRSVDAQLSASGFTDRRQRGLAFTANRTDGADASLRLTGGAAWQWSAMGYGQWRELESSFASVDQARQSANRVSLQDSVPSRAVGFALHLSGAVGGLDLQFGTDSRHASGESRELFSYVAGQPTRRRVAGGEQSNAGVFAQASGKAGPLKVEVAARIDRWRIEDGQLREWELASLAVIRNEAHPSRSGWRPTARLGASLEAAPGSSVRAAAYLGWRLPTLNELFRPFRAGSDATAANPALDPERLQGVEVGSDFRVGRVNASATLFANRLSGAIANVTLGQGPGTFPGVGFVGRGGVYRQRRNLDAIVVRGVEAGVETRQGAWTARLDGTLIDATVKASAAPELDGLRPAQTPKLFLGASAGWEDDGKSLGLQLRHVGRQFEDDLNRRALPAATTLDAFAAWPILPRLQAVFRAENLFDKLVVAGIGGDGAIERATPRTLWLGLRFGRQSTSGTP